MFFELAFQFLLQVVKLFHLVVYESHCIKLFDVVCFFPNQTFLRILVGIFSNLILFLELKLKTIFGLRRQTWFGLKLCAYVSNFDEVAYLLVQVLYLKFKLM